jgi:hypothetical protein
MALGYRSGVLTGVGLCLMAAFVLPRWGRPIAKATIKGGMGAYESATETVARLRETLEDLTAEAAFERAGERGKPPAPAPREAERREPDVAPSVAAS